MGASAAGRAIAESDRAAEKRHRMFKEIQVCRICGNPELDAIVNLGNLALTGVFPRTPQEHVAEGPLELVKCGTAGHPDACGLVQLRHSFAPDRLYGENYGYRSGLNRSMVNHLADIVRHIQSLVALKPGDLVLDIGSNDGTTLDLYRRPDLDLIGIDPTGPKFHRYYPPHVRLIPEFFSATAVRRKVGHRRARAISSIAMLYDLEAPLEFMRQVHELLADDGVWVFEQSYLPLMLARDSYDTICHEHVEYYALRQIKWLTDRAGLKIIDVHMNQVNGGSFQVTAARQECPLPENTARIAQVFEEEQRSGID